MIYRSEIILQRIEATFTASLSELRKSPSSLIEAADGGAIAILNHNRVTAYMVPAGIYEDLLDRLEDFELADIARSRSDEKGVPVDIDDL